MISLDRLNFASTKETSLLEAAKDIPFIDESVTGSSSNCNASQMNEEEKPVTDPNVDSNKSKTAETAVASVRKENLKHVSWSGCLSTCACIPKKRAEDDSFMAYSTVSGKSDEKSSQSGTIKKTMVSGIEPLSDTVSDELKFACGDTRSERELESSGGISLKDSKNISIEYKYTDDEDGIEFIAAKMPSSNG